eukprot:TRINITY_DN2418_c0_g1_i1.p1 TRINITY_DN2418_c0_g1~~TRINITY_DN2418_c0_g1_i1.p1  ORF type:complete len:674 (+),score=168.86 TRINITY_DN2418_c0_g1_i1:118-2139(+)
MDFLLDDVSVAVAVTTLLLGALWWFFVRDDGGFDSSSNVKLTPIDYGGLSSASKGAKKKASEGIPVTLIFYSQTGTAEDFTERLSEELETYGFAPTIHDAEEYETDDMEDESSVIIMFAATYGEGEPPDNAVDFHDWFMDEDREDDLLEGTSFAVFGLGNRTYDKFNEMGNDLDRRCEELGSKRIIEVGQGDDDTNIESDFLVWKKALGIALCKQFGLPPPSQAAAATVKRRQYLVTYQHGDVSVKHLDVNHTRRWRAPRKARNPFAVVDAKHPLLCTIKSTTELHSEKSDRSCLHTVIDTEGGLKYETGDHLGVFAQNDPTLVHQLASKVGGDLNQIISICAVTDKLGNAPLVGPCTLKAALTEYYDITSPAKKSLCAIMAQYATDEDEKRQLRKLASDDPDHQEEYMKFIVNAFRTPYEVLKAFPSAKVPVDHFLESLHKMLPRYYSISSSPNVQIGAVDLTAVLVDYVTPTKRHAFGVVTKWLSDHRPSETKSPQLPCFIRRSHFKLPKQLTSPIVMVGPGTGLAPFRGFLQELRFRRSKQAADAPAPGSAVLFFGCRYPDVDYIYQDELEGYEKDGTLSTLSVAFSRAQKEKEYVQHKVKSAGMPERIWNCLQSGGRFYICGDAKLMARDVQHALHEIVMTHGKMDKEEADAYITRLINTGKYLSDVWS